MTDLELLEKERTTALERLRQSSTVDNVRAFDKADRALSDCLKIPSGKDFDSDSMFPNVASVVKWLDKNGWRGSVLGKSVRSTVYSHAQSGRLKSRQGLYLLGDILRYAEIHLKKMDPASPSDARGQADDYDESLSRERAKADTEKAQAQAKLVKMKAEILTGKYIERAEFERALSARAAMFKQDLENFFRSMAGERVSRVDGDSIKIPDLIEFDIKHLESCLGRYGQDWEFAVPGYAGQGEN